MPSWRDNFVISRVLTESFLQSKLEFLLLCEGVTYLDFWTSLHPPTNHCHAPIVIVMLCSALCFPTKLYVQVLNDSSIFVFRREYLLGIHDAHSFIPYSTKSSEVNFSLSVSQFSFQVIFLICVCVVLRGFHYWETIRATVYLFCIRRTLAGHLRLMLMTCCCCCCSNSMCFHSIYSHSWIEDLHKRHHPRKRFPSLPSTHACWRWRWWWWSTKAKPDLYTLDIYSVEAYYYANIVVHSDDSMLEWNKSRWWRWWWWCYRRKILCKVCTRKSTSDVYMEVFVLKTYMSMLFYLIPKIIYKFCDVLDTKLLNNNIVLCAYQVTFRTTSWLDEAHIAWCVLHLQPMEYDDEVKKN